MEINKEDLKGIYETLLNKILNEIRRHFEKNLISVVLYGSMARGEVTKDSDIDLLIISDNLPKERSRRQDMFMEMEKESDEEVKKIYEKWGCYPYISPILKTKDDARNLSPLYLDMLTDAKILYDKDDFFKKILEKLRLELKSLNARKIKVGKKWYWDLKPDYKFGEVIKIG
ncbi:MAG TPA: nucleotidyltransferase domain-containing protein [Candidatus Limnocylindrales bacterium]|nr:nucleotidyltransferase domain-containing protein [Candidatus Limnocylindrales bacterium]